MAAMTDDPFLAELGDRLRQAREANGWTISQAARQIWEATGVKVPPSTLAMYERGERRIKLDLLNVLIDVYETTASFLFGEVERTEAQVTVVADQDWIRQVLTRSLSIPPEDLDSGNPWDKEEGQ